MIIGVALAVFQQITGINTIIYYAPTLLASAGLGNSAALLANVVNGAVNVLVTIVAIRLLDRTGADSRAVPSHQGQKLEHLEQRLPGREPQ